ncbi:integrase [Streptomyces chattanoogensis]
MTYEELLALPAAVDLDTANKALTIGRSTGYALAKRGEYPVAVLRLGNAYRVVTAELHRLLGVQTEESVASSV